MEPRVLPSRIKAPNGLTLLIKENHSTPIVALSAYCLGGIRYETEANQGITHLMQRVLLKGTQNRSAEETALDLEYIGSSMSPFTGKDIFGVSMNLLSKHFPRGLEIFADCVLHPTFPENEVEKEKKNILLEMERKKDDILSYSMELCDGLLFAGHPYRFPVSGREASVSSLTSADLQEWHRQYYSADRMVICIVGDVNPRHVKKTILQTLETLPARQAEPERTVVPSAALAQRFVLEERDKRQVAISLGFHAPPLASPEMYPFEVMNYVLSGMGSRLFIELRDRQGLAYVVNCHYDSRLEMGAFRSYISTSADRREQARAAMVAEFEKLKAQRIPAEELHRTKEYMLGLHEIALQRNGSQAARYAFYELTGLGYKALEVYPSRIRRVTAFEVMACARKYLVTDQYALAEIVPREEKPSAVS